MNADPYFCGICELTFTSEQASFEHDISKLHHERYDRSQMALNRDRRIHCCSICDVGRMTMSSWLHHVAGKRHLRTLASFRQYYASLQDVNNMKVRNVTVIKRGSKLPKVAEYISGDATVSSVIPKTTDTPAKQESLVSDTQCSVQSDTTHKEATLSFSPGGLMLNILESVHPEISPTRGANDEGTNMPQIRENCSYCPKSTVKDRTHRKNRTQLQRKESKHPRMKRTAVYRVTKPLKRVRSTPVNLASTALLLEDVTTDNNPLGLSEQFATTDLGRMQEALELSRQLETLSATQATIEHQMHQMQNKLEEIKFQKRELKLRRTTLLRGLTRSESDDEPGTLLPSMSATTDSLTRLSSSPATDRFTSERQVASVAPVTATSNRPTEVVLMSASALPTSKSFIVVPSQSLISSNIGPTSSSALGDNSSDVRPTQLLQIGSTTTYAMADGLTTGSSSSLPTLTQTPQTSVSLVDTSTGAVDFKRLALIRQALQSPDSWQFTFENVDHMLQRTAARAAATGATTAVTDDRNATVTNCSSACDVVQSTQSAALSTSVSNASLVPSVLVKGEPTPSDQSNIRPNGSVDHTVTVEKEVTYTFPVSRSTTQPGDEDESEGEQQHQSLCMHPPPPKLRKIIKADPNQSEAETPVVDVIPVIDRPGSQNECISRSDLKTAIKYGEFHAFDGGTAAVIDMILHRSTFTILIGGQNGVVSQFSLQTHQRVKTFSTRDASVTRMVTDTQGCFLFVGYYDKYFAQYDIQSSTSVFEKYFSNRIEALAVPPPSCNVPFIYLGMSNGDILRHHTFDFTTSLLYQCSAGQQCAISSMALVQSGPRLTLVVGSRDHSLVVRDGVDGSLIRCVKSAPHKGPPEGVCFLRHGNFCAYSERALRIHNWMTGLGVLTIQTQKITSLCVMQHYIAIGDSEGSIRVHKLQSNGVPFARPLKVYYATTQAAITSLISCGVALVSGSLDGTVTVIWITEPASDYTCLYGPFGQNCGIGFATRKDLIAHVMNTHLIFGSQKSVMCRWGAGRCRTRFTDTRSVKAISDHLLTHIPD